MQKREYEVMGNFETEYWWHQGKRYLIKKLMSEYFPRKRLNILEVGCGTGELTQQLQKHHNVMGIDMAQEAIDICKEREIRDVYKKDIFELDTTKLKEKFDLVLALDVMEHIQEDIEAMKIINLLLKRDGYFFVNVPAHKFLWSGHDEALQHKRRYTKYELLTKLELASFKIVSQSYFVMFVFPIILLYRTWGNLFNRSTYPKTSYVALPTFANKLLFKLLILEANLIRYITLRVGTTITVVAKKG